ncbi:tryptophan 2,3-dioxygenase family protein [Phreatobacter sp.]|uniref:tryptophan 2,3-dioxygenase family protein n=1 Tax=Phreatobacter sp. TaxID=1966341 RepID=UPI0025DE5791|nr:tryptophan 2,3-dioxygenase family protein [Phreatobacter sp.]
MARAPVYYGDYLKLDRLLSAQEPESVKEGVDAHDEMLFIIVHQAYELWFKQVLHELDRIERDFGTVPVDDDALARIVHGLNRIHEILKLTLGQLDVLETMTPFDFLDFRDLLMPASGFQSLQFRLIETRLGLASDIRVPFDDKAVDERLSLGDRQALAAARARPSLFDLLDRWLARTPFLEWGGGSFREAYREAVKAHLTRDKAIVEADTAMPAERRERELKAMDRALAAFAAVFSPEEDRGGWRLGPSSVQAALFITLYRDKPAVHQAFRLLAALMDIDETMTLWRYRHALMVERMIGVKIGTGGSSGGAYLKTTAERHRIFGDLFRLSTFLIPRSALPPLPAEVQARMGLVYAA